MTCPLCEAGRLRVLDRHVELSERGERDIGPCLGPGEFRKPSERPWADRLREFIQRVNRDCHKAIPLPRTTEVPPPRCEPEGDREP